MTYRKIMDLILEYGAIKFDMGLCELDVSKEQYQEKTVQKFKVLDQICEAVRALTSDIGEC